MSAGQFRAVSFPERRGERCRERPDLDHVNLYLFFQEGGTLPGPRALGNTLEKTWGLGTIP